jgi:hypothetical protein
MPVNLLQQLPPPPIESTAADVSYRRQERFNNSAFVRQASLNISVCDVAVQLPLNEPFILSMLQVVVLNH